SAHHTAWFIPPVCAGAGATGSNVGAHSGAGGCGECRRPGNTRYLADGCLPDGCVDHSRGGNAPAAAAETGATPFPSPLPRAGMVYRRRQTSPDFFLDRGRPGRGLRRSVADVRRLVERRRMGSPGVGCGDSESEHIAGCTGLSGGKVVCGGELRLKRLPFGLPKRLDCLLLCFDMRDSRRAYTICPPTRAPAIPCSPAFGKYMSRRYGDRPWTRHCERAGHGPHPACEDLRKSRARKRDRILRPGLCLFQPFTERCTLPDTRRDSP